MLKKFYDLLELSSSPLPNLKKLYTDVVFYLNLFFELKWWKVNEFQMNQSHIFFFINQG